MKRRKIKSKKKKIFEGCNKREIISNWLHSNFTQHHQFANGNGWRLIYCRVHGIFAEIARDIKSIIGNVVDTVKRVYRELQ